ncbi:MAG: phosphoribosylformylglycinamidine synthase [Oscillospiraceae bacterium]|nr:phosphoribosylformylglycinamidine synthase [Oscillospiraceae bacterium]
MAVYCIYVEKKPDFAVEAGQLLADLRSTLGLDGLTGVRLLNRYFIEGVTLEDFLAARDGILCEPPVDITYERLPDFAGSYVVTVEYLPGQFDQRADGCAQCISLLTGGKAPTVRCAKLWVLEGRLDKAQLEAVKKHIINPIESREASLEIPATLSLGQPTPEDVPEVVGFTEMDAAALKALLGELGLAMNMDDLALCQGYFQSKKRNPTLTELRVLDTYWSDHCRHTTFHTQLEEIEIEPEYIRESYRRYREIRQSLGRDTKPVSLMDMATVAAKSLRAQGLLDSLHLSEEVNACTVKVNIDVDGQPQDWLLMFKNETHNHPTEIEPFGGAATCLGGAIRDPLSGRSYVYQAMRISGAADPLQKVEETLPGKLPQKKICQGAAAGYSSYGNQIGLATGLVHEIYHPGYAAKRLEMGAVIGAAPAANIVQSCPGPGDKIILLGGRTGRDGCGGATGSSKAHTADSLESCGSEVQKGNAPEERKIQRLLRDPQASTLIKRCNDFGAGGVSVAIGELADGLEIDLDALPLKYDGLSGTELAISESQERMAVVVSPGDADKFIALAGAENLEATVVAEVTAQKKLVMRWRGKVILELDREFLDTNGAPRTARVSISTPAAVAGAELSRPDTPVTRETMLEKLSSLQLCSQKGLIERFDSTVGAGSVLLPLGGEHQLTPAQVMAAKLPVLGGETSACSLMSWAYDPDYATWSPYHGAIYAVIESLAKIIAAGGSRAQSWLTFQEYYERLGDDPQKWGKPAAALLGAIEAQMQLGVAAVGGKDSMSGSFEGLHVPPTLISVAVGVGSAERVISPEFKRAGSPVYLLASGRGINGLPDFESLRSLFDKVERLVRSGQVLSSWAVGHCGSAQGVFKMCVGNRIGFAADKELSWEPQPGAFILETSEPLPELEGFLLGHTTEQYMLKLHDETIDLAEIQAAWEGRLEPVYPTRVKGILGDAPLRAPQNSHEPIGAGSSPPRVPQSQCSVSCNWPRRAGARPLQPTTKPLVAIPVFPGTNCEYDTARAFTRAGARVETFVVRNLTPEAAQESATQFAELVGRANIVALPGGFSAGDEPEGSAKLIAAFLRGASVREKIEELLQTRDGLMLGICNGFQALVKLGLVPFGEYRTPGQDSPTLSNNLIGRHQSGMVRTRIASNKSPWLSGMRVGDVCLSPISHGEGRFIAGEELIRELAANGQVATQYVDFAGNPSMDIAHNPNGSAFAIEGITSPDGRVLGKMAHNERWAEHLYRNMPPHEMLDIFKCSVDYYA